MTINGQFNSAQCVVLVHTLNGVIELNSSSYQGASWVPNTNLGTVDDSVVSCSTTKRMGEPFGTFNLELINKVFEDGTLLIDQLKLKQLVVIKFAGGSSIYSQTEPQLVMTGIIEGITSVMQSGDKPTQRIKIEGSDLGKLLYDAKILYSYWRGIAVAVMKNINILGAQVAVSRHTLINNIIQRLFFRQYNLSWDVNGNTRKLEDIIGFALCGSLGVVCDSLNNIVAPEGSFWDVLKDISNAPFFELFVDTISDVEIDKYVPIQGATNYGGTTVNVAAGVIGSAGVSLDTSSALAKTSTNANTHYNPSTIPELPNSTYKIRIIFRRTPFIDSEVDRFYWDRLPTTQVSDLDFISASVSNTSHEVANYFNIVSQNMEIDALAGNYNPESTEAKLTFWSVADLQSIDKYGPRKLEVPLNTIKEIANKKETQAQQTDNQRPLDTIAYIKNHCKLLFDWSVYNDEYLSGQITLQGNPDPKIGTKLEIRKNSTSKDIYAFYIQAVSHNFVSAQNYSTVVDVVRGFNPDEVVDSNNGGKTLKHSKKGFDELRTRLIGYDQAMVLDKSTHTVVHTKSIEDKFKGKPKVTDIVKTTPTKSAPSDYEKYALSIKNKDVVAAADEAKYLTNDPKATAQDQHLLGAVKVVQKIVSSNVNPVKKPQGVVSKTWGVMQGFVRHTGGKK